MNRVGAARVRPTLPCSRAAALYPQAAEGNGWAAMMDTMAYPGSRPGLFRVYQEAL
jgi:hypothetical protein